MVDNYLENISATNTTEIISTLQHNNSTTSSAVPQTTLFSFFMSLFSSTDKNNDGELSQEEVIDFYTHQHEKNSEAD